MAKNENLKAVSLTKHELLALTSSRPLREKYPALYSELTGQNDTAHPGMLQTYFLSEKSRGQLENLRKDLC